MVLKETTSNWEELLMRKIETRSITHNKETALYESRRLKTQSIFSPSPDSFHVPSEHLKWRSSFPCSERRRHTKGRGSSTHTEFSLRYNEVLFFLHLISHSSLLCLVLQVITGPKEVPFVKILFKDTS